MRWLFFILLTICFLKPNLVRAGDAPEGVYVIQGSETYSKAHFPGKIHSLYIPPGSHLTIEAGVRLVFDEHALFLSEGELTVKGAETDPVVFTSGNPHVFWRGVYDTAGLVNAAWLQIEYAEAPLNMIHGVVEVNNLTLRDNLENTFLIGDIGTVHTKPYKIAIVRFENRLLGARMGNEGIFVRGSSYNIIIREVQFYDNRSVLPGFLGVAAEKVQGVLNLGAIGGGNHCRTAFKHTPNGVYIVSMAPICANETIPIVFVPGFGTSINLSALTDYDYKEEHPLEGWRFFQGLTPAYNSFINNAQSSGISVYPAYYDWRLKAEDIVKTYLLPKIEEVKQETGSPYVHLVGHSFGGLIARTYIQSDAYKGDVLSLTEAGTPNQGSLKAYSVWEAGELPEDWQVLNSLLRWYQYHEPDWTLTQQQIIHKAIPSVQQLLPSYPSLKRAGTFLTAKDLVYSNPLTQYLKDTETDLLYRVPDVTTYYSESELTAETLEIGPPRSLLFWRDGRILDNQPNIERVGDGTVVGQSARIARAHNYAINGKHASLTEDIAKDVITRLYPGWHYIPFTDSKIRRDSRDMLWFFFDCPVVITITLPDGTTRKSDQEDSESQIGNVAADNNMTWMLLPYQKGDYSVSITALADTNIRFWVEMGPIEEKYLSQGQTVKYDYSTNVESNDVSVAVPTLIQDTTSSPPQNKEISDFTFPETPKLSSLLSFQPPPVQLQWSVYATNPTSLPTPNLLIIPDQSERSRSPLVVVLYFLLGLFIALRLRKRLRAVCQRVFRWLYAKSHDT